MLAETIKLAATGSAGGAAAEGFFSLLRETAIPSQQYYFYDFGFDSSDNIYTNSNYSDPGALVLAAGGTSITTVKKVNTNTGGSSFAATIDSSQNIYNLGRTSSQNYYFRMQKFNSSGAIQWAKEYDYALGNILTFLSAENDGSYIYATGNTRYSSSNQYDRFPLFKIDTSTGGINTSVYTRNTSTFYRSIGNYMTTDNSGNIIITTDDRPTTGSGACRTIFKFNTSCARQWATTLHYGTIGAGNDLYGGSVASDSSGNIYVAGSIYRDLGSGTIRLYLTLTKLNSSGVLQWSYLYYLPSYQSSCSTEGMRIALDASGNIYVVDAHVSTNFLTATGTSTNRIIVWKFDSSGNLQFCNVFGHQTNGGTYATSGTKYRVRNGLLYCGLYTTNSPYGYMVAAFPTDGSGTGTYSTSNFGDFAYESATATITRTSSGISTSNLTDWSTLTSFIYESSQSYSMTTPTITSENVTLT